MWNGLAVCDRYITETCVYILFDAGLCLVRDILMETGFCSVFKGETRTACRVGRNARPSETVVSGSRYGHTHVSVHIVVRW